MPAIELGEARIAEALVLAEATPKRIAAISADVDESRLIEAPAPDAWSALKILNHLRACEEVWMHSVHAMLAHENPSLKEIPPRQWIKTLNPYTSQSFHTSLQVFTLRREAILITLKTLSYSDWARECRIDRKTHSVFTHIWRMVQHENVHCDEIEAILS